MLQLRSLLFRFLFFVSIGVNGIAGIPSFLIRPDGPLWVANFHARITVWMLRVICRIKVDIRGQENLPKDRRCLVVSKHQSLIETVLLCYSLPRCAIILKRELMWLPIFGQYLMGARMVPIERDGGIKTMRLMLEASKTASETGRELVIFPEGTRKIPGEPADYKPGAYFLYSKLDLPVIPLALNTGLFWFKGSRKHRPGTIILSFLPAVETNLGKDDYQLRVNEEIESACAALNAESLTENPELAANIYIETSKN